ncbi:MAG: hypothetical protein IJT06_05125 [Selenomonadaceae bacterium]|nr:hypothetical protein [Selenomonadaceae bacterium]
MKMNERGFFSLVGICFLLVAAILVTGLQEYELNYYGIAQNFAEETDLQNAADSALVMAMETLKENPDSSPTNPVLNETWGKIHVEVYAKKNSLDFKKRYFNTATNYTDKPTSIPTKKGIILMSVASRDSDKMVGKIYRRSLGYFFTDENEKKYIHFMKSLNKD